MNSQSHLLRTLIGPDATDADESRRDYMTRVVFVMMGIVLCIFTLVIVFGWSAGVFDLEGVAVMLLMDVPIATGWWLARHEHWRLARYIPITVTFGLALYGSYYVGLVTTLVLFYVMAILLAAMLHGGKAQWIVLGLSILTHLAVGWSRTRYPFSDLLQIVIIVRGSFTGIALLQWLSTNQLQHALASTRATAGELQAEIAQHKRAEEALRESEDKYHQLFELESDAIVLVDNATSQILEANAAASALYGYSREEWRTMKNTDVSTQPDETRRVTVEGGTLVPVRYHRKKDGTVFQVEMHGGSIKAESEAGKGSRFIVSLPWREPREGARRESDKATQKEEVSASPGSLVSSSSRPVKVLVAEDNEEGLYTLMEYLPTRGYAVVAARNGVEAILWARTERPAVIVMDIQMPGMDGLEAIRRIRADADLKTIPIIALTALAMPGDRERCLEAGANEYLSKPVSMKELVKTIEAQLQRAGDQTTNGAVYGATHPA